MSLSLAPTLAIREIDSGSYHVKVRCPACHVLASVVIEIGARLIMDEHESSLAVKVSQHKVSHLCGQAQLPFDDVAARPGPAAEPGSGPIRADDWAERAAGGRGIDDA